MMKWFKKECLVSKLNKLLKHKKYQQIVDLVKAQANPTEESQTFYIWSLMETQQLQEAKAASEKAAIDYPEHPVFMALHAEVEYRLGNYDVALSGLTKALDLSPGNLQVEYLLGLTHVAKGQLDKASDYFESILRYDPSLLQTRLLVMAEHYIHKNKQ